MQLDKDFKYEVYKVTAEETLQKARRNLSQDKPLAAFYDIEFYFACLKSQSDVNMAIEYILAKENE